MGKNDGIVEREGVWYSVGEYRGCKANTEDRQGIAPLNLTDPPTEISINFCVWIFLHFGG